MTQTTDIHKARYDAFRTLIAARRAYNYHPSNSRAAALDAARAAYAAAVEAVKAAS